MKEDGSGLCLAITAQFYSLPTHWLQALLHVEQRKYLLTRERAKRGTWRRSRCAIPGFHEWNEGCEQILYQVSSADVEETDAAYTSEISLHCPLLR